MQSLHSALWLPHSKGKEMTFEFNVVGDKLAITSIAVALILGGTCSYAQKRIVYECKSAAGVVVFSDRACVGNASEKNISKAPDEELQARKAEHDAAVIRDKALGDQLEARRIAQEQAGRAAQEQQMQVNKAIGDKYEQELARRRAEVRSLPRITEPVPVSTPP
jgi:Skp family chaperone for outer membrane proteins